jgi:hypothetical protein
LPSYSIFLRVSAYFFTSHSSTSNHLTLALSPSVFYQVWVPVQLSLWESGLGS